MINVLGRHNFPISHENYPSDNIQVELHKD